MTRFAFAHASSLGALRRPAHPRHENHRASGLWIPDGCAVPALDTTHEMQGKLQSPQRLQHSYLPISRPSARRSPMETNVSWCTSLRPTRATAAPAFGRCRSRRVSKARSPKSRSSSPSACSTRTTACASCKARARSGRGGWGVLVTPGDTLANTFQKQLRHWQLARMGQASKRAACDFPQVNRRAHLHGGLLYDFAGVPPSTRRAYFPCKGGW